MSRNHRIIQLTRECDDLAARYWQQEASGREQSYKEWLNQVKKTVDFIKVFEKKCKKTP